MSKTAFDVLQVADVSLVQFWLFHLTQLLH